MAAIRTLDCRLIALLAALSALCSAPLAGGTSKAEQTQHTSSSDPRRDMITTLPALGPHPSLGDQARVFDRFVGTWDCDYGFFNDDGSVRHTSGELKFGWILDGRAIQDIWISYPKKGANDRGIGTSIRFYDSKSKMWQVVFVSPAYGALVSVKGGLEGNQIVLRGVDEEGSALRWSFNDIQADSFIWQGEKSRDGGKTWKLEEEHHMKRRSGGAQ